MLTTNNLLRRERLQSQERLSAQTVERVPLDVAQTILDLEVGSATSKMVMMMVMMMIIDLKGRVMEPAKPVVGQGKLVTANLWLQLITIHLKKLILLLICFIVIL